MYKTFFKGFELIGQHNFETEETDFYINGFGITPIKIENRHSFTQSVRILFKRLKIGNNNLNATLAYKKNNFHLIVKQKGYIVYEKMVRNEREYRSEFNLFVKYHKEIFKQLEKYPNISSWFIIDGKLMILCKEEL